MSCKRESPMQATTEIKTDAVDADELLALDQHTPDTCNGAAFQIMRESETEMVVKDGFVDASNSGAHCYVYDETRDVTIDVTLGQFNGCPDLAAWDGDTHPYVADWEEIREWEDYSAFEAHYSELPEADNPFFL